MRMTQHWFRIKYPTTAKFRRKKHICERGTHHKQLFVSKELGGCEFHFDCLLPLKIRAQYQLAWPMIFVSYDCMTFPSKYLLLPCISKDASIETASTPRVMELQSWLPGNLQRNVVITLFHIILPLLLIIFFQIVAALWNILSSFIILSEEE